jgi:hypothetical protein
MALISDPASRGHQSLIAYLRADWVQGRQLIWLSGQNILGPPVSL